MFIAVVVLCYRILYCFRENKSIPSGIQRQLMYLFERLPNEWTASQYLPWIKLLIFCDGEAELQGCLWMIFVSFVQRSKNLGTYCCVTSVKCVLLIAYALMKWLVKVWQFCRNLFSNKNSISIYRICFYMLMVV